MSSYMNMQFDCLLSLKANEVRDIHAYVSNFFMEADDPVYPGVRSEDLLESAVTRPFVGCPENPKYFNIYLAAATLTYGLTKNHPFNDGNKRTAVISMLAFLDIWKLQLRSEVEPDDLFNLMVSLTEDKIHLFAKKHGKMDIVIDSDYIKARKTLHLPSDGASLRRKLKEPVLKDADLSIFIFSKWLAKKTRRRDTRDRQVSIRELRKILRKFNAELNKVDGATYEVIRRFHYKKSSWLGLRKKEIDEERVCFRLHVGGENHPIDIGQIKEMRRSCGFSNYDYHEFYGDRTPADYFLLQHAKVLKKLARYDRGSK